MLEVVWYDGRGVVCQRDAFVSVPFAVVYEWARSLAVALGQPDGAEPWYRIVEQGTVAL